MKQRSYVDRKESKPYDQTPQEVWNRIKEQGLLLIPAFDNQNGAAGPFDRDYQ